jgi:hypothetical protein
VSNPVGAGFSENIKIKTIYYGWEPPHPTNSTNLANTSVKAGIMFNGLIVSGNTIENHQPNTKRYAIALGRIQNSAVTENTLKSLANGIAWEKTCPLMNSVKRRRDFRHCLRTYRFTGAE